MGPYGMKHDFRLATVFGIGAAVLALGNWTALPKATAAPPADRVLSNRTAAYLAIHNVPEFQDRWNQTSFGRMLADPAMQDFMADVEVAFSDAVGDFEKRIGMSVAELLALPEGELAVAVTFGEQSWAVVLLIDVGQNEAKVKELVAQAAQALEEDGATRQEEEIDGTPVVLLDNPEPQEPLPPDEAPQQEGEPQPAEAAPSRQPPTQIAYFFREERLGVLLGPKGQMLDLVSELLGRWDGEAEDVLADGPVYQQVIQRSASDEEQQPLLQWYVNPVDLVTRMDEVAQDPTLDQFLVFIPQLGLDKLKAIGGGVHMGVGPYDIVYRTVFAIEQPTTGLLNLFVFPNSHLGPESWVPNDISSYGTINWDFHKLWQSIGELYDQFTGQPGGFPILVQSLVAQAGLELDVEQDVIAPLGNRLTFLGDYQEPANPMGQHSVYAFALDDADRFAETLDKVLAAQPMFEIREFQGHLIYEMPLPAGAGVGAPMPGEEDAPVEPARLGVTVANDYLLVGLDIGLLEKLLREGEPDRLADSPEYQRVAEHFPEQTNSISFSRTEQVWRVFYDWIRSGQFRQSFGMLDEDGSQFLEQIDFQKMPPFDEVRQYMLPSGGYMVGDDQGLVYVSFSLRAENP